MKKHLSILALAIAGYATTPFAADGTLTFTSNVVGTACVVSPTQNVVIEDVPTGMLLNVGSVVASKSFEIELSNCPPNTKNAKVKFEGSASTTDSTVFSLDEPNSPSTAKGVALQLRNDPKVTSAVIQPNAESYTLPLDTASGNVNKLLFLAGYKVLNKDVQTGTANVTTQFTIVYP